MKQYKKRTIALVLASVITVVGAFSAENYKNSLMSLKFESSSSGSVNMTVSTKRNYENAINPIKKDASTYVIMLPETNSEMSSQPELGGNIESVDIKTMPYTTNSKGYTKITIKTLPDTLINAQKTIFIPEKKEETQPLETPVKPQQLDPVPNYEHTSSPPAVIPQQQAQTIHSRSGVDQIGAVDIKESVRQFEPKKQEAEQINTTEEPNIQQSVEPAVKETDSSEVLLLILSVILIITVVTYIYIKGKNKLTEILGEQPEIDISDKPKKKEEKKSKKIKKAITKLDKMYAKPVKMPVNMITEEPVVSKPVEPVDDNVIVDLDELFQEKTKSEKIIPNEESQDLGDEENQALEDFLSGFSFTDDEEPQEVSDEESFNEELYEKYINDENLNFSNDDIERIEKLLNTEISDDTLKNISEFAPAEPVVEKKPSHTEILENLVTSYAVHQNITFTKSDVEALYKLISVEIDNDFITDLKTNPQRQLEMQAEIEKQKSKPHKTSELLTLNVKDMLPDLSEALKKQGRKKIESEYKPDVVYYSEGYEVSKLTLQDELPDLAVEINNKDAYTSRPSDEIEYAVSGYDFDKLSIDNELPDLNDALENPKKYEKKEKEAEVDEAALLNNISNVTFKPFYDGTEEFEILNKFDDFNAPYVDDVQEEFNQFDGFEIISDTSEEQEEQEGGQENQDDFETLFDNNYVDLDIQTENDKSSGAEDNAAKLLQIIQEQQEERKIREEREVKEEKQEKQEINKQSNSEEEQNVSELKDDIIRVCVIDNEKFDILARAKFTDQIGCYLAKNANGYTIIGYTGSSMFKIKQYERLKSEKFQARVSEKLPDDSIRYLVRIGIHKFILNVSDDNLEYVMDLC